MDTFDVFSIDSIDVDQHLHPSIPPPLAPLAPYGRQKAAATLGVRRRVGEAKPAQSLRRPSPARSPLTRPQPPSASPLPLRSPSPERGRIQRTVSSPAKLTTNQKRRQVEEERKESSDLSLPAGDVTAFPSSLTRNPVRARTALAAQFKPPASAAKRVLSAVASLPSRAEHKPPQVSRSAPVPSSVFDLSSSDGSSSSSLHFSTSLSGADRQLMEELQYLLDGVSPSSPVDVRHSCAVQLLRSFHRTHSAKNRRGDGHQQFFLMRAHGGFAQLCRGFRGCADDPLLLEAFVGCAYLMSQEPPNAQCVTADGVESLLDAINGGRRSRKAAESEEKKETPAESEEGDDEEDDDLPASATQLRSVRRRSTAPKDASASIDDVRALFSGEAVFARTGQPYSASLLALVAVLSFSADAHFKATFSRVVDSFSTLSSLVHGSFVQLVNASLSSGPTSTALFHLQTLLTVLENLTHMQGDNQRQLLQAKVEQSAAHMCGLQALPFPVQSFPQLYFSMLQWCTHRVVHQLDQPSAAEAMAVDDAKADPDAVDVTDRAHVVLTPPTYTSLALLLCRLLVNLTNKSERGCQLLYHPYSDPVACLASAPTAGKRKTGVQIIADMVGLCWYHPHLRSPAVDPTSATSSLNAESDLFDLLTLSIGVMINTAEQSAVIREVLLENTHLSLRRQEDGALVSISLDTSASPFSLQREETAQVTWVACLVDIFAHTYLALLALTQQSDEGPAAVTAKPLPPLPAPVAAAAPQRYGSRAHSAPVLPATATAEAEAIASPAVDATQPPSSADSASLVHRMLCSYSAMVIAVLAVHDGLAFTKVQAALRGRAENAHISHRPSAAATEMADDWLYNVSPSPSPALSPPEGRGSQEGGEEKGEGKVEGAQQQRVIFSLRLVVRLLNDFVLLQHEGLMSEESLHSMQHLIAQLERRIRADSAFGF